MAGDAPDLNAAMLRAQQAANSGGSFKAWFEKPMHQGAGSFGVGSLGLFSGNIAGPFGLKTRSQGMAAQLDYERQRMAEINNAGHAVLAQAAAAAAPLGNVTFADIGHGHGLSGGDSFVAMVSGGPRGGDIEVG